MTSPPITLKIAEAQSKDAGRAIARIDPKDFSKIKADTGDVVKLKSSKAETAAKLMPCYPEMRGKGVVQIDGIARDNLGIGLDEKVQVHKVPYKNARTIVVTLLDSGADFSQEDSKYLSEILNGTLVIKGNKIRATFLGTKAKDFFVEDTDPAGVVFIRSSTSIKVRGAVKGKKGVGITYEDIGGLGKEIRRIREMIELPLKYPELFERLGIDPPKGVLLCGPPGCGKTLIARAVANETDAFFTHISGPEIMGKFYGESEGRLREIFEEAKTNTPAILFIDEIDSIAPKREEMGGEKQVERRVVAQLLALMDGLESRGQLIVIGATNIPNALDSALRRPGRFDREITIGIPDRNARKEILEIFTRGMPLAKEVDLDKLAGVTHGFVGADLEALAREAAMTALREVMPEIEFEKEYIPYEKLRTIEIKIYHFEEALKEVEPSALREVFSEIPNVKWDAVGGLEKVKQTLKEVIEWPLKHRDMFNRIKFVPPKGVLLFGAPGCGKTLLAKAVATELGTNFISVKGPELFSRYIGESEKGIREIFKKARMAAPCIVFFDEIDGLLPKRGGGTGAEVADRVVCQFLAEFDGIEELKGVVILGATNRLEAIDPALLRAGRFDFLLEISLPNEAERLAIFKIHTKNLPLDTTINLEKFAKASEGYNGADIQLACKKASFAAIREYINKKSNKGKSNVAILPKHFEEAIKVNA